MSLPTFSRYPLSRYPLNNITPFTYRDGHTFLEVLTRMREDFEALRESDTDQNNAIHDFVVAVNATVAELLSQLVGYTIEVTNNVYTASMMDGGTFSAYTLAGVDDLLTTLEEAITADVDAKMSTTLAAVEAALSPVRKRFPVHYGAVGDGVTDDTAAIAAFLAAGQTVFDGGTYFVTGGFQVDRNNVVLVGNGTTFIVDAPPGVKPTVLRINGNGASVSGFTIRGVTNSMDSFDARGRGQIKYGIYIVGHHATVSNNRLFDFVDTMETRAIRIDGIGGNLVEGNHISNLVSRGSGAIGDDTGIVRGILLYHNADMAHASSVVNNHLEHLKGPGATGIQILCFDGVNRPHSKAFATVSGNTIDDTDRRAIKVQASYVTLVGNTVSDSFDNVPYAPAPVFDIINSEFVKINGNVINATQLNNAIQVVGIDSSRLLQKIEIVNNVIYTPIGPEKVGIYASHVNFIHINDNTVQGGKDAIRVGYGKYGQICGNKIGTGDRTGRVIVTTSTCDRMLIANNVDSTIYRDNEDIYSIAGDLMKTSNNIAFSKLV